MPSSISNLRTRPVSQGMSSWNDHTSLSISIHLWFIYIHLILLGVIPPVCTLHSIMATTYYKFIEGISFHFLPFISPSPENTHFCRMAEASKACRYSLWPTLVSPGPLYTKRPFSHSGGAPKGKRRKGLKGLPYERAQIFMAERNRNQQGLVRGVRYRHTFRQKQTGRA